MAFLPTTASQIQQFAMALYGYQIGSITMAAVQADVAVLGGLNNTLNSYYNLSFGSLPTATVAANLVKNVGISTGADAAVAYVKAILDTTPVNSRGVAVEGILNTFSKMTADGTYGAAATYYNTRHAIAMNYTGESDVAVGTVPVVQVIPLTNGVDILTGTYLDDTFRATLGDDTNGDGTMNPGDLISGGAGYDTLQMRATDSVETFTGVVGQMSAADVLGVEKFVIQNATDGEQVNLDLINVDAALKDIEIVDSVDQNSNNYYFYNQQNAIESFTYNRVGAALINNRYNSVYFFDSKESLYSGANDTLVLNLENVKSYFYSPNSGSSEKENAIENLVINSTGEVNDLNWNDTQDVVKTVTIKGDADLTLDIYDPNAIISLDASALSGNFYNDNDISMTGDLVVKGAQGNNYFSGYNFIRIAGDKQTLNFTSYDGIDEVLVQIYFADAVVNIATGSNSDSIRVISDVEGVRTDNLDIPGNAEYTKLSVNAGAGDDYIWLSELVAGATITLGAGNDVLAIGEDEETTWLDLGNLSGNSVKLASEALKVTDFAAGDKLDLSACDSLTKVTYSNIELAEIAAKTTLSAAISALNLAEEQFASFVWGGSTYVYFAGDDDGDSGAGNYDQGNGLIQLVGFTGSLTSSNFVAPGDA